MLLTKYLIMYSDFLKRYFKKKKLYHYLYALCFILAIYLFSTIIYLL